MSDTPENPVPPTTVVSTIPPAASPKLANKWNWFWMVVIACAVAIVGLISGWLAGASRVSAYLIENLVVWFPLFVSVLILGFVY